MRIDHLYVETRNFEGSVAFWEGMGLRAAENWGDGDHRALRLVGDDFHVVLANCPPGQSPQSATIHLATADLEALDAAFAANPAVEVVAPLEPTHWGTRWIRVRDPAGNLYAIEGP